MDVLVVIACVIVCAVFAVSAVTKVLDLAGTRRMLAEFGMPSTYVPAIAVLLPVVEIAAAVTVAVPATAWFGGALALALLAAFTAAIVANLGLGRTPECRCFGRLGAAPIDRRAVARNVLLAVPAVLVIVAA